MKGKWSKPYWSLVADRGVPPGCEQEFVALEPAMIRTSDPSVRNAAKVDSLTAAVRHHQHYEAEAKVEKNEKCAEDQFLLAAQQRHTRFQVQVAAAVLRGTKCQTDAEEHLQRKSLEILEEERRRRWVSERAGGRQHRGLASELLLAHWVSFPTEVSRHTEYLQTRHSEPCNRGSLKVAHGSFVFLEETAVVEIKLTQQSLNGAVYKEPLATAEPGRPTR